MSEVTIYQERVALFDMDGSLADFDGAMRTSLEKLRSPEEPPLEEDFWSLERLPHIKERMRVIKATPGWWRNLPRIEAGFDIVHAARQMGYQINVLTKGPANNPTAWAEKVEWCRADKDLWQKADIHITENKGLVYGTFLYDDYPDYMDAWLKHRPRGLGIMPATAYNKSYSHPNVVKYTGDNYEEVCELMRKAFQRSPREPLDV